ncbi:MAG: phosphotransferase [Caldilineaceae bacterium]|nr:phosphotransferase [Caldilineaceae bacterium]
MQSKADTHIHTTYSDGAAAPEAMVDYVVECTDLQVIAVTDHDTAEGGLAAQAYARQRRLPLDVIVGQEVTTDEGDIVALFVHQSLPAYHSAHAAVQAIHAQGGLAIAVHPFSAWASLGKMTGVGRLLAHLPLDGVEIRNGFPTNTLSNRLTQWINRRGPHLSELGGSDSHVPHTVGQAFTWFPGRSAADLRRALLARRTRAGGPLWTPASLWAALPLLRGAGLPAYEHTHIYGDEPAAPGEQRPDQLGATHPRPSWAEFSQKP